MARGGILSSLEIPVDRIVERVQLVRAVVGCRSLPRVCDTRVVGPPVGADRLVPETQADEDVRGHVLRVRRGRRDPGVRPRRGEAVGGHDRRVGGVNDVVRETGMAGIAPVERIEERDRPTLLRESGIRARGRRHERQRVVDGDLDVPRQIAMEPRHRVGVRLEPDRAGHRPGIAIERRYGVDESLLAGRGQRPSGGEGGRRGAQRRRRARRSPGERVAPGVERATPVRHGARGVRFEHGAEGALALLPPERVEDRHGVGEPALCLRAARHREHHAPQPPFPVCVRDVLLREHTRRAGDRSQREQQRGTQARHAHVSCLRMQRRTSDTSSSGGNGFARTPHGNVMPCRASSAVA